LLSDLISAFRRDPLIDEYDVLPVPEPKHNKSPFILQEHKLGVEAWAVKVLLKYCINRLIGWRQKLTELKFLDPIEICNLSRAILLFNPDNYTAWNIRKELIENCALSISADLSFGTLVLTKHPKSPETFIHRRWLFHQLLDHCLSSSSGSNSSCSMAAALSDTVNMDTIDVDVNAEPGPSLHLGGAFSLESSRLLKVHSQTELELCGRAAGKYPSNYHAWSHRIWIIQHCFNCSVQILLNELKATEGWSSSHISDYSGFHFRQFLLRELHFQHQPKHLQSKQDQPSSPLCSPLHLCKEEMNFVLDLIKSFPGHEALWCHRRSIFQLMMSLDLLTEQASHVLSLSENNDSLNSIETDNLDKLRYTHLVIEKELVLEIEVKNCDNYQTVLATKYLKWLDTYPL